MTSPTLRTEAVAQALALAETGEGQRAALRAAMEADEAVYRAIMLPWEARAIDAAIAEAIRSRRVRQRAHLWNRPPQPDARVELLAQANGYTILDMRLPNGQRLGDATRDDLRAAIDLYRGQATAAQDKARFFAAIARKVPAGKRVADCLRASEIEKLRPKGRDQDAA